MFGMGLSLSIEDFKKVFIYPKGLIAGLVSQIIILPSLAFLIAELARLPAELKVGIVIIAACPGGATSNLITYLLRGNVALSISMTTINSFITLVTTPLLIFFGLLIFLGAGQQVQLPILPTIFKIFYITLLPTSLGLFIRFKQKKFAQELEKPLRYILPILYLIIYLLAIFGSKETHPTDLMETYASVAPYVLGLNLFGMGFGFFLGRSLRQDVDNQITLAVEVGIQNSALAITIASSTIFLNNYYMSIPAIVYGFFTFASAILFGIIMRKIYTKKLSGSHQGK